MVFPLFDPEYNLNRQHDRSLRAAEQYELQRALRDAAERRRSERRATRKVRSRRYLRFIVRRTSPVEQ